MILYLAGKAHTNRLDFMEAQENDALPVKKMVGSFFKKQFILHDMRNFSHNCVLTHVWDF